MAIPSESFVLIPGAEGTLQQQIRTLVAEGILSGRFRPGDRLPSGRGLAAHLGIARITVTLAYADLVAEDYLTPRGRSGHYVSATAPRPSDLTARAGTPRDQVDFDALPIRRFSGGVRLDRPEDWRRYPYPFIYGQADATLFDHQNWRLCALRALGRRDIETLTGDLYDRDDPLLIETIRRSILPRRGIDAAPEEVLITLGAQNGLWLSAQVLLGPGRVAVMENPGYPGLRSILEQTPCLAQTVDVDADGLPPQRLPDRADVVFTTASHHCPTNATMPLPRRLALLKAASDRNFLVVEDDYEFEMSFLAPASPSLKSLDREGRVIHAGSFSKSIFPGLRLGYLVGPEPFIREARALRTTVLRHPPGHIQRTVAYFLSLGHYDALVNRMKQTYLRRRQGMEAAIRAQGLDVAQPGGFGGSSFWMRTPPGIPSEALALRLRPQGVLIEPGTAFLAPGRTPDCFYRLAYSSIPESRIADGVGLIAAEIARG